jgi:hypothetical protein
MERRRDHAQLHRLGAPEAAGVLGANATAPLTLQRLRARTEEFHEQ